MKRKIAVCDDDPYILQQVGDYLKQLENETKDEYQIYYFQSGEEMLQDMPRDIEIIFLDIEMDQINGIETAELLRKEMEFYLIFITSKIEYALKGYEVHAFGFLRKPILYSSVKKNLLEITERLNRNNDPKIVYQFNGETKVIFCKDIYYIESLKHDITIVTNEGKHKYIGSLKELETKLMDYGFFRCHNSYIVNMKYIAGYSTNEITINKQMYIPISKYRIKEFQKAFTLYQGDTL